MINYNISLNKELAQIVEKNIKLGKYANRSEFFREMIRKIFVFRSDDIIATSQISEINKGSAEYEKLEKMSKDKKNITAYSKVFKKS